MKGSDNSKSANIFNDEQRLTMMVMSGGGSSARK